VRLVFAPEQAIAFFGGDPDNFEYPRYDLDICLFRVYEGGKTDDKGKEIEPARPAEIKHYLKWAKESVKDNDLVFVSGHPGPTRGLNTLPHPPPPRDVHSPSDRRPLNRAEGLLPNWSGRTQETRRIAREDFFGVQNSRKAYRGMLAALLDPRLMG